MRVLYITVLVVIVAALAIFAYQNDESITLHYFRQDLTLPVPLLIAGVYVLGMLSGWSVVGFLRRSWRRALEHPQK
jgi:uncharacterized integral membrane protein